MLAQMTDRGSFAGHETFPFRYTWLRKTFEAVQEDPKVFGRDDAMVLLGVGKNMVRSMRHWALVSGIIEEVPEVSQNRGRVLQPTELARELLSDDGWDPYLEDPATVWLLHWQICWRPEKATTWHWVYNHVPQPEFSRDELHQWLTTLIEAKGWKRVSAASLKRDIDCFIRTYVPSKASRKTTVEDTLDCPLVELGLLREFGGRGSYILHRGEQPTLPSELVAYALAVFVNANETEARTLPLDVVGFAAGSPGRVFCLGEDALLAHLERLDEMTDGALVFDETAGMRQVMVRSKADPFAILDRYYARSIATTVENAA